MTLDPVATNPNHHRVIFVDDHVPVLGYTDQPGDRTTPHEHPKQRHVHVELVPQAALLRGLERDVEISAGTTSRLPAQQRGDHNSGDTPTRVIHVELKDSAGAAPSAGAPGPN